MRLTGMVADTVHGMAPGRQVALDAPATPEAILRAVKAAHRRT
jgi:xanthine dehydrogenase molybdopterin-binding subunit B